MSGEMHCLAAEGTLEVAEGGVHTFALVCVGYARVLLAHRAPGNPLRRCLRGNSGGTGHMLFRSTSVS